MKRFHSILQHDAMQCGTACLTMVCNHYGLSYSMEEISEMCPATAEGVSLYGMIQTAKKLGFTAISTKASLELLSKARWPVILHWNQNHFVVLYKIKNGHTYYIADPGKGLVRYTKEEFVKHWACIDSEGGKKGIAMLLEPEKDFHRLQKQTLNLAGSRNTFGFLLGYINQYKKYLSIVICGLGVGCILQIILPFLTQSIVDIGIKYQNIRFIWLILLGEFMILVGRTSIDFIRRWLLLHISMRINISLISDFFIKLLKLPMSFFDTKLIGDLLQRISDHSRVQSFLTNHMISVVYSLLSFVILGLVLLAYNPLIFGVFIFFSAMYAIWISAFLKQRKIIDYELFEQQSKNHNKTYQFITAIQEIKLQNCEQRRRWEWEDIQADLFQVQLKSLKLQQTQEAGSMFINEIKNIIITVLSATSVINGELSLGMMLAIQYIIGQLNSPIEQLMNFIYTMQDVKISLDRIHEIYNSTEEDHEKCIKYPDTTDQSINIEKVNFKYNIFAIKYVLDNVSFQIPGGKVTAIVGASGSGKTTLIKLILGFYYATSGTICISGENIKDYNLKEWRKQCGVVMQDGVIFSESIARNIAVDDSEMDNMRLENAARIANIHNDIMKLPLQYNTRIGRDGIGISQGQKQRILIARAVYKNPRYIFLDEATNALDAENERIIVENLSDFCKGRTVVVVAHRLSTVKNANQIIVLDQGKVVEIGNHNSLIKRHGKYYNLIRNQLELG